MIEILELTTSPKADKRFRITLDIDGTEKRWDFGARTGSTYLDHEDDRKRANYWARHCGNHIERRRIVGLIPSAALFSAYLLWGESPNIFDNLVRLNALLQAKYND